MIEIIWIFISMQIKVAQNASRGLLSFYFNDALVIIYSVPSRCTLSPAAGPCRALKRRYYFNIRIGKCSPFNYGGCGGNANNFQTAKQCRRTCLGSKWQKNEIICCSLKHLSLVLKDICMNIITEQCFFFTSAPHSEAIYGNEIKWNTWHWNIWSVIPSHFTPNFLISYKYAVLG